jgi:predicted nuclease of predicted toxin-antitoxin system
MCERRSHTVPPPKLLVLLDEGVPAEVGNVFRRHGHELIPFKEVLTPGSADDLVCTVAQANNALLVAYDNDMKQYVRRQGQGPDRFKRLHLLKFNCPEPMAAKRLEEAMSLIGNEWAVAHQQVARRVYVEINTHDIRTFR